MKTTEQFLAQVMPEPNSGCWLWMQALTNNGYPLVQWRGRTLRANRLAYTLFKGTIPVGDLIRHTCHTRSCVNPDHLIPGDHTDNALDMMRAGRHVSYHAKKTHCKNDHEFTDANTLRYEYKPGKWTRECRACGRDQKRRERGQRA